MENYGKRWLLTQESKNTHSQSGNTYKTLPESRLLLEKPATAQDEFPKQWLTQILFEGSN